MNKSKHRDLCHHHLISTQALRLIKFAAGKAGTEFRREIQRQAPAVLQFLHYRGVPEALKGDALNKAVRETAQDALSAIFASNDEMPGEAVGKRMEGFGSTNFDSSIRVVKKTMFDDMMGFGSSSIRQISGIASSGTIGNYGVSNSETYSHSDSQASTYSLSSHETFESRSSKTEGTEGGRPCHNGKPMSQEDRLVDAVTTPGGVRLQPSREEVQNFLTAATKLDGDLLGYALLSKLQARLWQVRLKAMCIVEAVLRQGDSHDVYQRMGGIFQENYGCIDENAESPQASLKEKSKKVLGLLGRGNSAESRHQTGPGHISPASYSSSAGSSAQQSVVLPDLLDGWDASEGADVVQNTGTLPQQQITSADAPTESSSKAAGDDLLRVFNWNENALQSTQTTREGDHLAELSVNTASTISFDNDLFSGLRVDAVHGDASSGAFGDTGLFEGLGVKDSITAKTAQPPAENLVDLFDGLSTETSVTVNYASIDSFQGLSSSLDSKPSAIGTNISQLQSLSGGNTSRPSVGNGQIASSQFVTSSVRGPLPSQMMYTYPALLAPTAGGTFQPSMASLEFAHGPAIIAGMSALMMQQQLAANLETMQALGIGMGPPVGTGSQGNGVSTCSFGQIYNDGFDFSNPAGPAHSTEPQKEETKAFDWLKLS